MQTMVGVKIPQPGYLDPHLLLLLADEPFSLGFVKLRCKVILLLQLKITRPFTGKKTFFTSNFQIADLGGGQDTPARVS